MNTQNYQALPQVLSALAMSSVAALVGGWVSFTSVALPMMIAETESFNKTERDEENLFVVDIHVGSWIVSIFFLGTFFGCYLGGPLTQIFGCNKTVLFSTPPGYPDLGDGGGLSPCVGCLPLQTFGWAPLWCLPCNR